MSMMNRRALLFHSGSAVVASTVAIPALSKGCLGQATEPSLELLALIDAHKTAYSDFGEVLHTVDASRCDPARASRDEERALLAVCSFAAVGEGDRLAKARYLLEIEARGELDLTEHMQAVLRSTMWKT